MPLLSITQIDGQSQLGLWKIGEGTEELKWALQWGQNDIKNFKALKDEQRSMHWLSSRVLLRRMLNTNKFIDLQMDEYGKPFIKNMPVRLSISHSGDRVAVLISDKDCGIDIQVMKSKIQAIAPKFVSKEEWKFLKEDNLVEQLYVFWCAKEALYKLYGKKKLNFRDHLFLDPFEWNPDGGKVKSRIEKGNYSRELTVRYYTTEDYMVAYAIEK